MARESQALGARCFVTVGTTSFDEMIQAVCSQEVCMALRERGITQVVFQVGRGQARPQDLMQDNPASSGLDVSVFDFAPSLDEHMQAADLILSHGGAGSIMESLGLRKPVIVVINESLMENHQWELAGALVRRQHLMATNCDGVAAAVRSLRVDSLVPYPSPDRSTFPRLVDDMCEFTSGE
mmetsp:Transcript_28690/g.83860  ORF Transcript_28690/g.83860 Transcript_28690/m.83860 type:complete len:181 (-) Transcript_28690:46-588(-)